MRPNAVHGAKPDVLNSEYSGGRLYVDGRPAVSVQDYIYGVGRAHFSNFERKAFDHAAELRAKASREWPDSYVQLYVVVSHSGNPLMVKFWRLAENGVLETGRAILPRDDMSLEEAYAYTFGNQDGAAATHAALVREFRRTPLVADASLFTVLATGDVRGRQPKLSPRPNLTLRADQKIRLLSDETISGIAEFDMYAAKSKTGDDIFYPVIRRPKLLGRFPPHIYANHAHALSQNRFDQKQLSIFLMEDSVDTTRELLESRFSIGVNATKLDKIGATELAQMESKFAERTGKTIAIVGHYESGVFFARSGKRVIGSIRREKLDEWSKRYGVELLLLGCGTAANRSTGMIETVTAVDPYQIARSLSSAASKAKNWGEFLALLSSEDMPLLLGSEPSQGELGSSRLVRRLPDGRLYPVALVMYRLQCAFVNRC